MNDVEWRRLGGLEHAKIIRPSELEVFLFREQIAAGPFSSGEKNTGYTSPHKLPDELLEGFGDGIQSHVELVRSLVQELHESVVAINKVGRDRERREHGRQAVKLGSNEIDEVAARRQGLPQRARIDRP